MMARLTRGHGVDALTAYPQERRRHTNVGARPVGAARGRGRGHARRGRRVRPFALALASLAALAGCGGAEPARGGSFADQANRVCESFNPRLKAIVEEELAGERVSRERLEAFWQRYPDEHERQLAALRGLDSSPPRAAADYLERLERNLAGYRDIAGALASGSGEAFASRTYNSELDAHRLAERAGLSSCSPPDRMRPTAYGASLVDSAIDGR